MIILAHVGPPGIIFQLRNFDVPLMVIVSGMSFGLAFKGEQYSQYVWKRIKRLVFPVWIFLSIYFLFLFALQADDLNFRMVLSSYFLIGGIGYVWIIRVFLLVALLAPFIYLFHKNTKSDSRYLSKLLAVFFLYEFCRYYFIPYLTGDMGEIVSLVFFYAIPYSILFALGLRIPTINNKNNMMFFLVVSILFVGIASMLAYIHGEFMATQQYKYPPSIYYFSYAISVSVFLWIVSSKIWKVVSRNRKAKSLILFMAQNSIWIYLWHIPLIEFVKTNFFLKYLIVVSISVSITYLQVWIVTNYLIKNCSSGRAKRNLKVLLTG